MRHWIKLRGLLQICYILGFPIQVLPLFLLMTDMHTRAQSQPHQQAFNPYTENGGTILAIAGADFSVIAGDTRQSEGYNIQTRYAPKVFRLWVPLPSSMSMLITSYHRTDKAVLAVNGFAADGNMFVKKVRQRLEVCPLQAYFPLCIENVFAVVSSCTC